MLTKAPSKNNLQQTIIKFGKLFALENWICNSLIFDILKKYLKQKSWIYLNMIYWMSTLIIQCDSYIEAYML